MGLCGTLVVGSCGGKCVVERRKRFGGLWFQILVDASE